MRKFFLRNIFFISLSVIFANVALHGAEEQDLLATLGKQLNAYAAAHPTGSEQDANRIRMLVGASDGLAQALSQGDMQSLQTFLNQLSQMPDLPADLKTTITQLQSDLPRLLDAADDKYVTDVDAMIAKTHQACLDANTENDLDPMLKELGTLRRPRNGSTSPLVQRQMSKIDAAIQFVTRWQDALAQRAAGNLNSANEIMAQLAKDNRYPIMTQEEIQAHTPPKAAPGPKQAPRAGRGARGESGDDSSPAEPVADPAAVREIFAKINTLDDLDAAIADMGKISQLSQGRQDSANQTVGEDAGVAKNYLEALQKAYAEYQQGFYDEAIRSSTSFNNAGQHDWMKEVVRLRGMFIKLLVPKYLALPVTEKPASDENAVDFLLRMAAQAKTDHRWSDLQVFLDAYRQFGFGSVNSAAGSGPPAWLTTDIANCRDFAGAQKLEASGNLVEAITAYQRILKQPGNYSPTDEALVRLQALQKSHPESYQEALKLAETQIGTDEFRQQILVEVQQMIRGSGARGALIGGAGRGLPTR